MDLSSNGTNTRQQDISGAGILESRPSVEARSPQTPRLQKKRSNPGTNPSYRRQTVAPNVTLPEDPTGAREGVKTRKGSLRNAVRKIFGRRSREAEPQPSQISPPRHGYHRSEPNALAPHSEVPEGITEEEELAQRTFSAPLVIVPPAFQRVRSPYAVEFPQSARLKPINLGDPFSAPGSRLRRRKTLPSILVADSEAAALSAAIRTSDESAPPLPRPEPPSITREPDIGTAVSSTNSEKRRSRSLGDLRITQGETASVPRKRSEEMRYWRESLQGSVLRASGFRVPSVVTGAAEKEPEEQRTPLAPTSDPFESRGGPMRTSPSQRGLDVTPIDIRSSPSALGTELSQDLEDRVARLEAGLRNFQGELALIASDRNRRTALIGGAPTRRRASSGGRTASMLAETLQSDLEPSSYQYDFSDTLRPSTSPQPPPPSTLPQPPPLPPLPRTPVRFADPSTAVPAIPVVQGTVDDPFTSPPPIPGASAASAGTRNGANQGQTPQYAFRSLYEMLADERSARRRLEQQMRGLRDEIANLHYQVSLQSNVQSQRSSYYATMEPMVGSSRLHALLQETEGSRPGTGQSQQPPRSVRLSAEQPGVVSRFSGSESEAGTGDAEDLQTPYEVYQTPREEQRGFPFAEQSRDEGEMF